MSVETNELPRSTVAGDTKRGRVTRRITSRGVVCHLLSQGSDTLPRADPGQVLAMFLQVHDMRSPLHGTLLAR